MSGRPPTERVAHDAGNLPTAPGRPPRSLVYQHQQRQRTAGRPRALFHQARTQLGIADYHQLISQ